MRYRLFSIVAATMMAMSCAQIINEMDKANEVLEESIRNNTEKIAALEKQCSELNANIQVLQSAIEVLRGYDFVEWIKEIFDESGNNVIGYTIKFIKSGEKTIYFGIDGEDAHTPVIGVKKDDDGLYYWTIDGEWMMEGGNKIQAEGIDGITPLFKISSGNWFMSMDGGKNWTLIGEASGKDGESFFLDVKDSEDQLVMILADGTVLTLPKYHKPQLKLDIDENCTGAAPGIDVYINYMISGGDESTKITASSDGNYSVKIEKQTSVSGTLVVTPPVTYKDGFVNVILSDDYGFSQVTVINFEQNEIIFTEGLSYKMPCDGGRIEIPFSLNFDYHIECDSDWIIVESQTKSEMREECFVVEAGKNESFEMREATIKIFAETNNVDPYVEILISQSSAYFTLEKWKFAVPYTGGAYSVKIESSLGVRLNPYELVGWITAEVIEISGNEYELSFIIQPNGGNSNRYAFIPIYEQDGDRQLATLQIIQICEETDSPYDMVFTVRANYPNNFTVQLPLSGQIDCYVEWGDGDVDYYNSSPVIHKYDIDTPESFVVRISGTVTALRSYELNTCSITEVNQWGKTGLDSMNGAFINNTLLRHICGDTQGSFEKVNSFDDAFSYCINLEEIPENLFAYASNANRFARTFYYCSNITEIPENLFYGTKKAKDFTSCFQLCTKLEYIPEKLLSNCPNTVSVRSIFYGCSSLRFIPELLFACNPMIYDIAEAFHACTGLTEIPRGLFDNNRRIRTMNQAFSDCNNLRGESPYTVIDGNKVHLYERNSYIDYFVPVVDMSCLYCGIWNNLDDRDLIPEVCR